MSEEKFNKRKRYSCLTHRGVSIYSLTPVSLIQSLGITIELAARLEAEGYGHFSTIEQIARVDYWTLRSFLLEILDPNDDHDEFIEAED